MVEQLRLLDPEPPQLTDRQQHALDAITTAGEDGLYTEEVGAILHAHHRRHAADECCLTCGRDGLAVARELKRKGKVVQRARPTRWVAAKLPAQHSEPDADPAWDGTFPVPYGVIPF